MPLTADVLDFTKELTVIFNEGTEHSTRFIVHESLVTAKSDFFKAACRNEWKEATSRVVILPDIDIDTFQSYLCWIYSEKIAVRDGVYLSRKDEPSGAELMGRGGEIHTSLAKLWILADRLADMRLRNAVVDEMVPGLDNYSGTNTLKFFPPELTTLVWSSTTAERPLRRLALDYYISCVWVKEVRTHRDDFDAEFARDLMVATMEKLEGSDKEDLKPHVEVKKQRCYYHEHGEEDAPCPSKK